MLFYNTVNLYAADEMAVRRVTLRLPACRQAGAQGDIQLSILVSYAQSFASDEDKIS